ncbi:MAG: hypothetical protein K940chlam3_01620, partial [Chlamydiae bacterium]|nr:hypothetical protein [Chlamydiota bacterium]
MCFSAESSFSAAALLTVIGYATISDTKNKKEYLLAAIPLLFAIQQFSEGVLWVCLMNDMAESVIASIAKWIYIFFAFVNWPIWLPLSLYFIETQRLRKVMLLITLAMGTAFVVWNFSLFVDEPVTVGIVDNSIQYSAYETSTPAVFWILRALYVSSIIIPCFVSSYRYIWSFGLIVALSFVAAEYFYHATFTSVWCLFAAVASAAIFVVLRLNRQEPTSRFL